MVTAQAKMYLPNGRALFDFRGLSADTKPTGSYQGDGIGNGSTFVTVDGMNVFVYDEGNEAWCEN